MIKTFLIAAAAILLWTSSAAAAPLVLEAQEDPLVRLDGEPVTTAKYPHDVMWDGLSP
jgi:hypothetical protein